MELLEILNNASIEDVKIGLYVMAAFMSMQVIASIGRYYFGVTLNPFDIVASFIAPKHCQECKNTLENCCCFIHLKSYEPPENSDD